MQQPPDFLYPLSALSDFVTLGVLFVGILMVMRRESGMQRKTGYALILVLLVWFGVMLSLSINGVFIAKSNLAAPFLPMALLVPVIGGLWFSLRSQGMVRLVDATPLSWLTGLQFYRIEGGIFLVLMALGGLPAAFAIPAGVGDVAIGLAAVPVALALGSKTNRALNMARVWNYLGILDLVIATTTGFLTSPGPFQLLAIGHPNFLATQYPLVMIPVYLVPLSLILHGFGLWKLNRVSQGFNTAVVA